ncbi:hypothetical protein M5689_011594 [Euphorbia peplus]|nr:hypothetical protein M5689_011594 [Euphorbia peplus]
MLSITWQQTVCKVLRLLRFWRNCFRRASSIFNIRSSFSFVGVNFDFALRTSLWANKHIGLFRHMFFSWLSYGNSLISLTLKLRRLMSTVRWCDLGFRNSRKDAIKKLLNLLLWDSEFKNSRKHAINKITESLVMSDGGI